MRLDFNKLIRQMNENFTMRQSVKSLQKFKSVPIEQRVHLLSNQLLANPKAKVKPQVKKPSVRQNKSQDDMAQKIVLLQNQLKQKISEDSILRNFFKTLNSSKVNHIDIYLQLKKCEQIIGPLQQRLQQQSQKSSQLQQFINKLETQLEYSQMNAAKTIIKLQNQINQIQKTHQRQFKQLRCSLYSKQDQLDNSQLLIVELNKKNDFLLKENKLANKKNQQLMNQNNTIRKMLQKKSTQNINKQQQQKLRQQLMSLKQVNSGLQEQIESLYASKAFSDKIKQLYQRSQQKIRQIDAIQYELHTKDLQIKDLTQKYRQKEVQLVNASKKLLELTQVIENKEINFKDLLVKMKEQRSILVIQLERVNQCYKNLQQDYSQKVNDFQSKQKLLRAQFQDEKALLTNDLNRQKFKDRDVESIIRKAQFQKKEQQKLIQKLEDKIIETTHWNELLKKKYQDLKKEVQYNKSYEQLNEKVYCQNYKAIGRIAQIAKQIQQILGIKTTCFEEQQQTLQFATAFLAKMSQFLISQFTKQKEEGQILKKKMSLRYKQSEKILGYLKKITNIQNIQNFIDKYVALVHQQMQNNTDHDELISQTYHLIVQRLMTVQNLRKTIPEDSLNTIRDSLQRIGQQEYKMGEEFNKQNVDLNQMKRPSRQPIYKLSNINRQSNTTGSNPNHMRSQIQRKYFRA